jgi:lipopolysaccharide biosynthesis protein
MSTVCLFASYFQSNDLPYYITVYLKELKNHFDEVILLTSQPEMSAESNGFLAANRIDFFVEKNEGFDFGQWRKALQKLDLQQYDQIALVNDSCILFKPLDEFMRWSAADSAEIVGMTFSEAIAPHLQSYFLIVKRPAFSALVEYFNLHGVINDIKDVISTYEVGLSTFFVARGFRISAYMGDSGAAGEFSPYYSHIFELLSSGIPLIKKKIVFSSYRDDELLTLARMNFDVNVNRYVLAIKKHNSVLILSIDALLKSEPNQMNQWKRFRYSGMRCLIQLYKKFKLS